MSRLSLCATRLQAFRPVVPERLVHLSSKPPPRRRQLLATREGPQEGPRVMEEASSPCPERRIPLSEVVSGCARRWFHDTLREAKTGDHAMQVLVGQMYHGGYGTPKNKRKGKIWMSRAARYRSSVWKVIDKHPGYHASDSDSELSDVAK